MKKIGIIGAMSLELTMLKESLEVTKTEVHSSVEYSICNYKGLDVVLACSGIGKVNAASCTQTMINHYGVSHVINTGIAGGLNEHIKVCDIVVSDSVVYHDFDLRILKSCAPYQETFKADDFLISIAKQAFANVKEKEHNMFVGKIATGDQFISDNNVKQNIIDRLSPACVEMEGAAIGHVAVKNDIPFVVIRCISDNSDDDANMSYEKFEQIAANNSAHLVLNILELIKNS